MKTLHLVSIVMHGERQSKATGWQRLPGYNIATLSDGSTRYRQEEGLDATCNALEQSGVDCRAYRGRLAEAVKPFEPSPAEQAATEYQRDYGYAVPEWLGEWGWSTTFGRWGRTVRFPGSDNTVFAYPKLQ